MIDLRPILFPPDSANSDIMHNVGKATSPFTGSEQSTEMPGARWVVTYNYKTLAAKYGRMFKAIKAQMRGGAEIAHIYDLSYIPRRGTEPGAPLVNGAGQSGNLLAVKGVTPSTVVYDYGDQISYLSTDGFYRMHMVTGPAQSNPAGNVVIPILPPMRNPPVDGTAVDSVLPSISATLTDSSSVSVETIVYSASFTFTEYLFGILP